METVNFEELLTVNKVPVNSSILNNLRDPDKTTKSYVETDDIGAIKLLNDNGWFIYDYKQVKPHNPAKSLFRPYMASYRNENFPSIPGEGALTILQRGSKDGCKKFALDMGFFRFVCTNGMIVGNRLFDPLVIKHIGDIPEQVGLLMEKVATTGPKIFESISNMSQKVLTSSQIDDFARKAINLRFPENKEAIKVTDILETRRIQDAGENLWRVLNRVQENLTKKGCLVLTTKTNKTRISSEVRNIDLNYKINSGLWTLAEEYLN